MDFISIVVAIIVGWIAIGFFLSLMPIGMQSDRGLERLKEMHRKNKNYEKYKQCADEQNRRWNERNKAPDASGSTEFLKLADAFAQKTQVILDKTMADHGVSLEEAHIIVSKKLHEIESRFKAAGLSPEEASDKAISELYGLVKWHVPK